MTEEVTELMKKSALAAFNCALDYMTEVDQLESQRIKPEDSKEVTKKRKFLDALARALPKGDPLIDEMEKAYKKVEQHAWLSSDSKLAGRSNEAYLRRLEVMSLLTPEQYRTVLKAQATLYDTLTTRGDLLEDYKRVCNDKQALTDGTAIKIIGEGTKLVGVILKAAGVGVAGGPAGVGVAVGLALGGFLVETAVIKSVEHREHQVKKALDESEKQALSMLKMNISETMRIGAICQSEHAVMLNSAALAVEKALDSKKCRHIQSDVSRMLDLLAENGKSENPEETKKSLRIEIRQLICDLEREKVYLAGLTQALSSQSSQAKCGIEAIDALKEKGDTTTLGHQSVAYKAHINFLEKRRDVLHNIMLGYDKDYTLPQIQAKAPSKPHKAHQPLLGTDSVDKMTLGEKLGNLDAALARLQEKLGTRKESKESGVAKEPKVGVAKESKESQHSENNEEALVLDVTLEELVEGTWEELLSKVKEKSLVNTLGYTDPKLDGGSGSTSDEVTERKKGRHRRQEQRGRANTHAVTVDSTSNVSSSAPLSGQPTLPPSVVSEVAPDPQSAPSPDSSKLGSGSVASDDSDLEKEPETVTIHVPPSAVHPHISDESSISPVSPPENSSVDLGSASSPTSSNSGSGGSVDKEEKQQKDPKDPTEGHGAQNKSRSPSNASTESDSSSSPRPTSPASPTSSSSNPFVTSPRPRSPSSEEENPQSKDSKQQDNSSVGTSATVVLIDEEKIGPQKPAKINSSLQHHSFFSIFAKPLVTPKDKIVDMMMATGGGAAGYLGTAIAYGSAAYASTLAYDQLFDTKHASDLMDWVHKNSDLVTEVGEIAGGVMVGLMVIGLIGLMIAEWDRRAHNQKVEEQNSGLQRRGAESNLANAIPNGQGEGGYHVTT